jgi:TPR repeat protein
MSQFLPLRAKTGLVLALVFTFLSVRGQAPSTNAYPPWPRLTDLIHKYETQPRTAVERAAEQGDVTAMHFLGYSCMSGLDAPVDLMQGISWYEKALHQGYLPSGYNLGLFYDTESPLHDVNKALFYFRYVSDRGLPNAKVPLAIHYRDGLGVSPDPALAMQWLKQAAEQGITNAMYELYRSYSDGRGVEVNFPEAIRWLQKEAATGDAYAEGELARQLVEAKNNTITNFTDKGSRMKEAVRLYSLAAKQGDQGSQTRLADLYLDGTYVEKDELRGVELMRNATDLGSAQAMARLSELYSEGIGEPRDETERPFELLCRAVRAEADGAQDVGLYGGIINRCTYGNGTDRDLIAAAQWYCRAAVAGVVDGWGRSVYLLGDKFGDDPPPRTGLSTPAKSMHPLLLSAYLKAAARHDASAALQLGTMYLTGKDAPHDDAKAWPWFKLAAQYGASDAAAKISQAEAGMTPAELHQAQQQFPAFLDELKKVAAAASRTPGQSENP